MSMAQAPQMASPAAPPLRIRNGSVTSPLPEGQSANLTATAQFLVFEPGLYAIDVIAERSIVTEMGLVLPSVRLEPVPATRLRPGRISVIDPVATGWLSQREEATFALALGGRAGAIMTIYRAKQGVPVPEIRIRSLDPAGPAPPDAVAAAGLQEALTDGAASGVPLASAGPLGSAPPAPAAPAPVPLAMVCHMSRIGDVRATADGWLGQRGSGAAIEGFSIAPAAGHPAAGHPAAGAASTLRAEDIEYQGILGNNWKTPWIPGGAFCGSRGMMLPLLGLCVRLKGAAAEAFTCSYDARFTDGQETKRPCAGGEFCRAGDVPLEAFRIVITARETEVAAAPPPRTEPRAQNDGAARAPTRRPATTARAALPTGNRRTAPAAPAPPSASKTTRP